MVGHALSEWWDRHSCLSDCSEHEWPATSRTADESRGRSDMTIRERCSGGVLTAAGFLCGTVIIAAVTAPIAFGSGAALRWATGHDFHKVDAVVTIVAGPVVLAIVWTAFGWATHPWADRGVRRAVRAQGRYRRWRHVLPAARAGRGTLILEIVRYGPGVGLPLRAWWTPDAVLSLAPGEPFVDGPQCAAGRSPFVDWCRSRYVDPLVGTALLTRAVIAVDDLWYPRSLDEVSARYRPLLPAVPIVVLPMRPDVAV